MRRTVYAGVLSPDRAQAVLPSEDKFQIVWFDAPTLDSVATMITRGYNRETARIDPATGWVICALCGDKMLHHEGHPRCTRKGATA